MDQELIKVLLIEDNPGDVRLLREIMNEEKNISFDLKWTGSLESGLKFITSGEVDVVLLDLGLPDSQGFETFAKTYAINPQLPIIVLSGYEDKELAIKAVRNGAQDYIVKGQVNGNLIVRSLRYAIERKRIEEELAESEKKFRSLYESSKDGIIFSDLQGNILDANSAFLDMIGYKIKEIRKLTYQHLTPKKWHKMDEDIVKKQIVTRGHSDDYEKEYIKKDGTIFPISIRVWLTKDEQGRPMGMWAIIRDIAERRRAEEALRESEEKFRTLAEKSPNMIFINRRGKILYANKKSEEIMGFTKDEFYSPDFDFYTLIARESRDTVKSSFSRHMKGEDIYPYEYTLITKEGRRIEAINTTRLIRYDGDNAILGIITDITERKRSEKEIRESFKKLRRTLGETVKALASLVDIKDPYTAGHQQRVTKLAFAIAKEMGLPEKQIEGIKIAGSIHDIGKICIPAEILSKPTPLDETEISIIQKHPQVAFEILKGIEFPWPVAEIVLQHHERMLGSGYPQGLSGEEILLEARILGVADVVEAMSSHRPYRPAYGIEKAIEEISRNRGILYDPIVVDTCLKLFMDRGFTFEGG